MVDLSDFRTFASVFIYAICVPTALYYAISSEGIVPNGDSSTGEYLSPLRIFPHSLWSFSPAALVMW